MKKCHKKSILVLGSMKSHWARPIMEDVMKKVTFKLGPLRKDNISIQEYERHGKGRGSEEEEWE